MRLIWLHVQGPRDERQGPANGRGGTRQLLCGSEGGLIAGHERLLLAPGAMASPVDPITAEEEVLKRGGLDRRQVLEGARSEVRDRPAEAQDDAILDVGGGERGEGLGAGTAECSECGLQDVAVALL